MNNIEEGSLTAAHGKEVVVNFFHKDKDFATQYQTVYKAFGGKPKTMLDVSFSTGILRANICRYVAVMEAESLIQCVFRAYDPHTHCEAGFYSTDPALWREIPKNRQLTLDFCTEGGLDV